MRLNQLAVALLCGGLIAAPAFAQSTTAPAGLGTSPNGATQTITTTPGYPAPNQQSIVPSARGTIGGPSTTTTGGAYAIGNRPGPVGAPVTGSTSTPTTTTGGAAPAVSMTNINTATATDLDKLPQIGKARAARIIKGRPYTTTDELVSKKVLPMSVYNKIKTQITAS